MPSNTKTDPPISSTPSLPQIAPKPQPPPPIHESHSTMINAPIEEKRTSLPKLPTLTPAKTEDATHAVLCQRRDEFRKAAVEAKQNGQQEAALEYFKKCKVSFLFILFLCLKLFVLLAIRQSHRSVRKRSRSGFDGNAIVIFSCSKNAINDTDYHTACYASTTSRRNRRICFRRKGDGCRVPRTAATCYGYGSVTTTIGEI